MADFSILHEVVPELKTWTEDALKKVWRAWVNEQPEQIRQWLTRPLSQNERRVLQCQFAVDWYRARSLEAQDAVAADLRKDAERAVDPSPYERLLDDGQTAKNAIDFGEQKHGGFDANGSPA